MRGEFCACVRVSVCECVFVFRGAVLWSGWNGGGNGCVGCGDGAVAAIELGRLTNAQCARSRSRSLSDAGDGGESAFGRVPRPPNATPRSRPDDRASLTPLRRPSLWRPSIWEGWGRAHAIPSRRRSGSTEEPGVAREHSSVPQTTYFQGRNLTVSLGEERGIQNFAGVINTIRYSNDPHSYNLPIYRI